MGDALSGSGFRPVRVENVPRAAAPVTGRIVPFDLVSDRPHRAVAVIGSAEEYPVVAAATGEHALYGQSGHAGVMPGAPRGEYLSGHALILIGRH